MIDQTLLRKCATEYGVVLDTAALERMDKYAAALVETNAHLNLTAITEPTEMLYKHFLDSVSVFSVCTPKDNAAWIDVGTGAGFPGAVLLMARPDLSMTFLDGTKKKLKFIEETIYKLQLKANYVHSRAEEAGQQLQYREKFDYVSARAVANLRELAEYCLPFVKTGGTFISMKSIRTEEELREAEGAIHLMGGKVEQIKTLALPNGENRTLIVIKKVSQTPTKYPRPAAKIAKQPLR